MYNYYQYLTHYNLIKLYSQTKTAEANPAEGEEEEGTVYDAAGIKAVADIPSREELLSRLLGSMQSPMANFARVINQIAEKNA